MKLTEEQIKQIIRKEVVKHLKEAELARQMRRWNKLPAQFFKKVIRSIEWQTSDQAEEDREFTYAVADINKLLDKHGPNQFLNMWVQADREGHGGGFLDNEAKDTHVKKFAWCLYV